MKKETTENPTKSLEKALAGTTRGTRSSQTALTATRQGLSTKGGKTMSEYGAYYGPNRAVPIGPTSPPELEPSLDDLLDEIDDDEIAEWWQTAFDAMNGDLTAEAETGSMDAIMDALARPLGNLYFNGDSETLRYKAEALVIEMDIIARKAILRQKGHEVE